MGSEQDVETEVAMTSTAPPIALRSVGRCWSAFVSLEHGVGGSTDLESPVSSSAFVPIIWRHIIDDSGPG
jgi:hypothetical protein